MQKAHQLLRAVGVELRSEMEPLAVVVNLFRISLVCRPVHDHLGDGHRKIRDLDQ